MASKKKILKSSSTLVCCNGGDASADHPKIYLKVDPDIGEVTCPYCSKVFKLSL
ncbi:MAG: zinc-finger domain-containing protein [Rickettsiaceae bacterium]|nr:zinc-finger domain-containing protein [Rickettsiaceae bacterium]